MGLDFTAFSAARAALSAVDRCHDRAMMACGAAHADQRSAAVLSTPEHAASGRNRARFSSTWAHSGARTPARKRRNLLLFGAPAQIPSSRPHSRQQRGFFGGRKLPDYYHVLQVTSSSDEKTIKAAYLRRAKQLHPDVNKAANAEARFKDLQEAYAILSCPNERALYDQARGGGGANADGMMGGPQPTGMHVHPAYRRHVNYQRGGGGGGSTTRGGTGAGADPWKPAKANVERGLFGALEMAFSRTGALVTVAAGCALLVGLGLSTLSPKESNLSAEAYAEAHHNNAHGMARRFYPDLAVADFEYDREASEGMQLVRAFWHRRKKKWIAADS